MTHLVAIKDATYPAKAVPTPQDKILIGDDADSDEMKQSSLQALLDAGNKTLVVDGATLSATVNFDMNNGEFNGVRVTGTIPAGVTIGALANVPAGSVTHIRFAAVQPNTPAFAGTFIGYADFAAPDWTKADLLCVVLEENGDQLMTVGNRKN